MSVLPKKTTLDRMRTPGRFPMIIIQHAIWLYHHFPLSYRDVQELLHQRGIQVSHETLREWCIKFGLLFAEDLRHREPRRGSRWHLDEVCTSVDGVRHWFVLVRTARLGTLVRWRAVDEYGFVLDIFLQRHRDTEAAKTFLTRLLGEYNPSNYSARLWPLRSVRRHSRVRLQGAR